MTGGKVYRGGAAGGPVTSIRGGSGPLLLSGVEDVGVDRALSARRRSAGCPGGDDSSLLRRSRACTGDTG